MQALANVYQENISVIKRLLTEIYKELSTMSFLWVLVWIKEKDIYCGISLD